MIQTVAWKNREGVAVVTLDNPPVNALGQDLRAGIWQAIEAAEADPAIHAVVICATGRNFSAGADIREFGKIPVAPSLPDLCNLIEACAKPVIAAIQGRALGGGLELALAAHVRIALSNAKVGLPEVTLGILPGAGGTQRAPRLVGGEAALRLILGGKPLRATDAQAIGLLDGVVEDGLVEAAIALAREMAADGKPLVPTRARNDGFRDPAAYEAAIAAARAAQAKAVANPDLPAPSRIVDCIEAALLLPFDAGLAFERSAFDDCLGSIGARGLRHAFLAERRTSKIPEAGTPPRSIAHVGVIGGGLMGAGIIVSLLGAGFAVSLVERNHESLVAGLERIADIHENAMTKGRMTSAARDEQWARLKGSADIATLAEVDLVIEAASEDEAIKTALFRQLDTVVKPGAILATNTSYLDINTLAAATSRPGDVVGLHFFSPAHIMRLMEVVVGDQTAPDVVTAGFALAARLGKIAVRAGVCDGFIGNRILTAYRAAADFTLEDGASPAEIDAAMRAFGKALGPYQVSDMAGLDISWARRKRLAPTRDPKARYVAIADRLCEAGRFGQKSGAGYYSYAEGRGGKEDPTTQTIIDAERTAKGITPRSFTAEEIQRRCLVAMANEGARILQEGIALRPSDIDVVLLSGYGYPRWRGGPMQSADEIGL
ncbi:MAG: enoyl-CoA hydratase/isomerase family protein, partial [Paracoccaceae bacterium]|nr:enoyl-CoA hydratase/isomerase family protein [Paracoccaceae bacterium]